MLSQRQWPWFGSNEPGVRPVVELTSMTPIFLTIEFHIFVQQMMEAGC